MELELDGFHDFVSSLLKIVLSLEKLVTKRKRKRITVFCIIIIFFS